MSFPQFSNTSLSSHLPPFSLPSKWAQSTSQTFTHKLPVPTTIYSESAYWLLSPSVDCSPLIGLGFSGWIGLLVVFGIGFRRLGVGFRWRGSGSGCGCRFRGIGLSWFINNSC